MNQALADISLGELLTAAPTHVLLSMVQEEGSSMARTELSNRACAGDEDAEQFLLDLELFSTDLKVWKL